MEDSHPRITRIFANQARWWLRYGLPLLLLVVGWRLWRAGVSVPGAPVVMFGLRPKAVAVDSVGNIYVADEGNQCIWKVDRRRKMERVAGSGQYGYSGDGGEATKARLKSPSHIV